LELETDERNKRLRWYLERSEKGRGVCYILFSSFCDSRINADANKSSALLLLLFIWAAYLQPKVKRKLSGKWLQQTSHGSPPIKRRRAKGHRRTTNSEQMVKKT
jgi:hypothetical protein